MDLLLVTNHLYWKINKIKKIMSKSRIGKQNEVLNIFDKNTHQTRAVEFLVTSSTRWLGQLIVRVVKYGVAYVTLLDAVKFLGDIQLPQWYTVNDWAVLMWKEQRQLFQPSFPLRHVDHALVTANPDQSQRMVDGHLYGYVHGSFFDHVRHNEYATVFIQVDLNKKING